jgi:phosphate transport system substrate-binding protein
MTRQIALIAPLLAGLVACSGSSQPASGTDTGDAVQINGAGATFPAPLYTKWIAEYGKIKPGLQINYQPLGSGAGIRQLVNRTVFFGASDQPMTDEQLKSAPGKILHVPTVLGAVVPMYFLPGITAELKFTGPLLADIFLGKVTKWNDPAIAKINGGVTLPDTAITVVHRSEGSGTSFIWTDYLSKVSPEFKEKVGADASVRWPTGVGGKGSEGLTGLVRQTPGSIGYVELVYAIQNKITYGAVQNQAGEFVRASIDSVSAAAASAAPQMPADFRVSITNPPGKDAYPIASFTWLLLYEDPGDPPKARALVEFVRWALKDGRQFARDLGYAPVPDNVLDMEMRALDSIKTDSIKVQ